METLNNNTATQTWVKGDLLVNKDGHQVTFKSYTTDPKQFRDTNDFQWAVAEFDLVKDTIQPGGENKEDDGIMEVDFEETPAQEPQTTADIAEAYDNLIIATMAWKLSGQIAPMQAVELCMPINDIVRAWIHGAWTIGDRQRNEKNTWWTLYNNDGTEMAVVLENESADKEPGGWRHARNIMRKNAFLAK